MQKMAIHSQTITIIVTAIACLAGFSNASASYICGNNSLSFSEVNTKSISSKKMNFNKDVLIFCKRDGNILTYRMENCKNDGVVIRYDWILKQIILNRPPREIILNCLPVVDMR